jgi:hypothetical protein
MLIHTFQYSIKQRSFQTFCFCREDKEEYVFVEVFTDMASGECGRVESEDGNPPEKKFETIPFSLSGVMHLRSSGGRLKQFSSLDPSVNAEKQIHFYYVYIFVPSTYRVGSK